MWRAQRQFDEEWPVRMIGDELFSRRVEPLLQLVSPISSRRLLIPAVVGVQPQRLHVMAVLQAKELSNPWRVGSHVGPVWPSAISQTALA
jgi:hypothetical protein